jgi:hypothetical protein
MAGMMQKDEVLAAALELPESSRADIADRLLRSLDPADQRDVDALWAEEAEARIDAFERGEIEAIPGPELFAAIRTRRRA